MPSGQLPVMESVPSAFLFTSTSFSLFLLSQAIKNIAKHL